MDATERKEPAIMSDIVERLEPCPFCGGTDSDDNACMEAKVFVAEFASAVGVRGFQVRCLSGIPSETLFDFIDATLEPSHD